MTSSVKTRPKFRVIEGEYESHNHIYEDFKKDFLDENIRVKDLLEKYDLSKNQYNHLRKRVNEETGVNMKPSRIKYVHSLRHYDRFISHRKSNDRYGVCKVIDGKKHHFGEYKDLETAVYVRDRMEASNWSQEEYDQILFELFGKVRTPVVIERIYDDFKEDWLRGESIKWLRAKYHIGSGTYHVLAQKLYKDTGLKRKPQLNYLVMKQHERDLLGEE